MLISSTIQLSNNMRFTLTVNHKAHYECLITKLVNHHKNPNFNYIEMKYHNINNDTARSNDRNTIITYSFREIDDYIVNNKWIISSVDNNILDNDLFILK